MIIAAVPLPSSRQFPRPRRNVPRWVITALTPWFRYSASRNAWILRGIGHSAGPVLTTTGSEQRSTAPERRGAKADQRRGKAEEHRRAEAEQRRSAAKAAQPPRTPILPSSIPSRRQSIRRPRWTIQGARWSVPRVPAFSRTGLAVALAAGATLAAAALGFTVARTAHSGGASHVSSAASASGLLRVSVPSGWSQRAAPAGLPLTLTDELAISPSARTRDVLVVGRALEAQSQLLPQSLVASLGSLPAATPVRLGPTSFYRYSNLTLHGTPWSASVYATPTTAGAVLGVCLTRAAPAGVVSGCERSLTTLRLTSGHELPLGAIPAYAAGLNATMQKLNALRAGLGANLRDARSATAQARAAYALAAAHSAAATALLRLRAGAADAANRAVANALALDGAAYRGLAQAASQQRVRAYNQARAAVRAATSAWQGAYSRLGFYGYSIG
jgi:hypothetical protein